jgi:uncharacterized membrane protein
MRIRSSTLLLVLSIITGAFILYFTLMFFNVYKNDVIQVVLGIPFLLFWPGFALVLALFPGRQDLSFFRRVAYSFGLSLVIVSFIGLILNFTPLGIKEVPVFVSITFFVLITELIASVRIVLERRSTNVAAEHHREKPPITRSRLDLPIFIAMVVLLIGSLTFMGYFISKPKVDEAFTQFYLVQSAGSGSLYPKELKVGQEGKVTLAVTNHEHREVSYRIKSSLNGTRVSEIGPIVITSGQTWQGDLRFVASQDGDNQKLEFSLFLDNNPQPYKEPLFVWINVN